MAKAKTLADSFIEHAPSHRFTVFLVDRLTDEVKRIVEDWDHVELIPIEAVALPSFPALAKRYDVVELSTAVKPHCFRHLLARHEIEHVLYLDPDTMLFGPVDTLVAAFGSGEILLTPQIVLPNLAPPHRAEFSALAGGMYNLGFLGLRPGAETARFLAWWSYRLAEHCRRQPSRGLFYDQSWVNFAPIMFDKVSITRHLGLNIGPWNLHERLVTGGPGRLTVNERDALVFLHFSHFDHRRSGTIAAKDPGCVDTYDSRPDLAPLYEAYRKRLLDNGHEELLALPYAFQRPQRIFSAATLGEILAFGARFAKRHLPRELVVEARRRLDLV